MTETKCAVKIKTYDEFVEQLTKLKDSDDVTHFTSIAGNTKKKTKI